MQGVSVRFRLGALNSGRGRVWLIPPVSGIGARWFKSSRPDFYCGGSCAGTGRRLLIVVTQVRFLPPQLNGRASQRVMAAASKAVERQARLVSSTLTPSATRVLGRAAEAPGFQPGEAGSTPAGHSFDASKYSGVDAVGSVAWL